MMKLLWKWNDAENCYAQRCSYTFRFSSLCWFHVHMILFVFLPSMLVITWTAFCRICFAVSSTLSGMFLFLRLVLSVIWLNYFQFETLWLILNWFMLGLLFFLWSMDVFGCSPIYKWNGCSNGKEENHSGISCKISVWERRGSIIKLHMLWRP